jgi:hypothetical protein
MARKGLILVAFSMIAGTPLAAASLATVPVAPAPDDGPGTRYCMHVGPVTGSLVETVQCWTRAEWAEQGVDVDREWAREGVTVTR